MGLLANGKDKTLTYKESKKYQRILKKIAALQITKLMKIFQNFSNSETDRLKYGIEQEFHLVTSFEYQRKSENKDLQLMTNVPKMETHKEYSVSLQIDEFLKDVPEAVSKDLEFMPEFAAWVMEIVPRAPFEHFLSSQEILKHLRTVDALNEIQDFENKNEVDVVNKKKKSFILSSAIFPKLGYADYYIRPNGDRIPYVERKEGNEFSGSQYYIDETVSKHVRFPTLTKNTVQKRDDKVEINIPLFVDKNTKFKVGSLYKDTPDYKSVPYKLEEEIAKAFESSEKVNSSF